MQRPSETIQKSDTILFQDDFQGFPIGDFPYDREHSAMGEYHFFPTQGFHGQWYDPIASYRYRGATWCVTENKGKKYMEQMRVDAPAPAIACPTLVGGSKDWEDYTVTASLRPLTKEEPCGMLVRYQTSLMHYGVFFQQDSLAVYKVEKTQRKLLGTAPFPMDTDNFYALEIRCQEETLTCLVDGKKVLTVQDSTYQTGSIALAAYMPVQYAKVQVTATAKDYASLTQRQQDNARRVLEKRASFPQPKLWKIIDLKNFGAGRQIRFGHLTGTEEMFFIICQNQRRVFKDRYPGISCMTAVSVETGDVLWQIGEPSTDPEIIQLTADLPIQIYDIDGDGVDEVIVARNFELMILDGPTGKIKQSIPTPKNLEDPTKLKGIEFKKHAFDRLNVDAIRIVNVSGNSRPSDIMIKDRYARLWVYNKDLELLWTFTHNNTGHFPVGYDFDGDGKDEIFSCYNLISSDGKLLWELPVHTDHTDEIIIGPFDPDHKELIALVAGWEGFMIVDPEGNILVRDINGHGQRISAGNYCPNRPGLELCTTTYWENQGILYMHDCKGNELWHLELGNNGNLISPVNWVGDGTELVLLNGNISLGGMMDGDGDQVVMFPDDGHPDLCAEVIDLTGDSRDEIVLWDQHTMYIYTQDREAPVVKKGKEYTPEKYPHYNASNYRGEYSFPRWTDKKEN